MLVSYNWLKDYLGEDLPSVNQVVELLTKHSFEVESTEDKDGDTVIDLKILPDRAGDCLSHRGVARELATLISKSLINDPFMVSEVLPKSDQFKITIENHSFCPRFMLAKIDNIKVKPSPDWLVKRLSAIGQKSINNIVDATNYVMFALGQPLHAYDADLFSKTKEGQYHFLIRQARAKEIVSLLGDKNINDDRQVELSGSELLIVDGEKDLAIGLAGVKGGKCASINSETKNIIIEAAHFDSVTVRQTAKKHGIATDAVKRFENNPSVALPYFAIINIVNLIKEIAEGDLIGVADEYKNPILTKPVLVRLKRINQILGLELSSEEVSDILKKLGVKPEVVAEGFLVTAPQERQDLLLEVDYIEEVGRIHGLNNIKSLKPIETILPTISKNYYYSQKIRDLLIQQGFSEVLTSSFRKKDEIQLQNALASDKSYLRSSLLPTLDEVLKKNIQNVDILGLRDVRIFEIGKVFKKKDKGIEEIMVLALGAQTKKTNHVPADDHIVNEALRELALLGIVSAEGSRQGLVEINLDKLIPTLSTPASYVEIVAREEITYKPFSLYPAIVRDIAMWVSDSIAKDQVVDILKKNSGSFCQRISLFDEFSKDGRTSYAFRLVFQSYEKTLTDAEVEPYMELVYKAAKEAGFETR